MDFNYCDSWNDTFNPMFHAANVVLGLGFSIPQNFDQGYLCMRFMLSVGLVLVISWASEQVVCKAPSLIVWNSFYLIINTIYVIFLIKKHLPTFIRRDLKPYYKTVFRPLGITKKEFKALIKDAKLETFTFGQYFCQEHRTTVDKRLYVLISGMMTVRCDGFFLQAIQPLEFVNSIEWKCDQYGQVFTTHQVSVEAISECKVLILEENSLEKAFDSYPRLRFVLDGLVGKDVAKKLYAVSDIANMSRVNQQEQKAKNIKRVWEFRRTNSVDAIHTGGKGHVRSQIWIEESNLKNFQTDEQVALVNFELDVPPALERLTHGIPVQIVDKDIMAEAQFLAQQRKYWPSGLL